MTAGDGGGSLSAEAARRLAQWRAEGPAPPLRPPDASDAAAVARWRESVHRAWLAGDPPAADCGHGEIALGGVRCLATGGAVGPGPGPIVVYLHGGGYALGSPEVALAITERLARRIPVVSVDYRLAPEHPYPAAVDDAVAVLRAVAAEPPGRSIVVAGDSAGANIGLAAVRQLLAAGGVTDGHAAPRHVGGLAVAGLVLLSPHLDHALATPSVDDPSADVDAVAAEWLTSAYCGPIGRDDPRVSPLRADLAGLPPTLVQVGFIDSSLPHAIRLARRARVAGVSVTLDVWDGLWHTWHYHRELPEADLALDEAARFASAVGGRASQFT